MTEHAFIQQIQDEITVSGTLPVVLEDRELQRIIKQQSKWAFENYEQAVESQFYIIPLSKFKEQEFKTQRVVQLPDCIVSVFECKEVGGLGNAGGNVDKDFAMNRMVASEIFLSNTTGDDLVMRTAQMQFFDLTKAYYLSTIAYDFNRNTKKIRLLGRDPSKDVFLNTYVKVPMDRLFDDYYFLRLCTAHAKLSYARVLGTYPFQLPGGVTINVGDLKSEGEQEIDKIKEEIDGQQSFDIFISWH